MAAFQSAQGCAPPAVGPFYIIGSIPKLLRIYFLFDRKLLAKLSICAWKVIKQYLQSSVADNAEKRGQNNGWRHSGFHVYIGDRIFSDDQAGLGNLARYIIRACFSADASLRAPKDGCSALF